uniref:Uncharacterized protein n=1 Tax=Rhizophora mucronata TaxID=61149 RepID=A0A2P2Q754_RHIMU
MNLLIIQEYYKIKLKLHTEIQQQQNPCMSIVLQVC